jgi:hypothetical protein
MMDSNQTGQPEPNGQIPAPGNSYPPPTPPQYPASSFPPTQGQPLYPGNPYPNQGQPQYGYPPQQPGYLAGYPPYYQQPPKKKSSKVWIPILIVAIVLLAVTFTFLAINGIFPARPEVSFSVSSHDFGDQFIDTEYDEQTMEISNVGHGKLVVESLTLDDKDNFILSNDDCSGRTLKRYESCSFAVKFSPQSSGSKDSAIKVVTNTKTSPDSIAIEGKAVIPPCNVAILGADSYEWIVDVKNQMKQYGRFNNVDVLDVTEGPVPSLKTLQEYDAILVYSDSEFYDSEGLGDVLADYVDKGGGVVLATCDFNIPSATGSMQGRLYNDGYMPFTLGQITHGDLLTMVVDDPEHPIMMDVSSFNGGSSSYHEEIDLANGAIQLAHWSNGMPLIAYTEPGNGRVVGLNFFPVSSVIRDDFWDMDTDGLFIIGNALMWAGQCYMGE